MKNETATRFRGRQRAATRQLARWLVMPSLAIVAGAVGSGAVATAEDIVPVETREVVDVLRLQCEGNDGAVAEVACRWTMPDGAVGVKVLRAVVGSGVGRQTVFRTDDLSINRFVDSPVRRGVRYLYVVRAFGESGNLVAASRPVVAGVAVAPDPAVEVIRLECSATGAVTARCRWTAPVSRARTLTLWRSVDGGARERVASFANPFPTSYGDVVPTATSRAVYAVIATDGAGEIVARSRADAVAFPPVDVRPTDRPRVDVDDDLTNTATATDTETEPAAVRTTTSTVEPPSAPSRPDVAADQRPASVPATTIPDATVDGPGIEPARPDDDRQAPERDAEGRSERSSGPRTAPAGERDRAG